MLKFTECPKTPGMTSKKILLSLKGRLFAGDFRANLMKQTLIGFSLQRDRTGNGLRNIKDTFAESLQLQMSVLDQSMSILQSSRLVSQIHIMDGWAKCKEKVPDVSDSNQNVETTCNSKLKFT